MSPVYFLEENIRFYGYSRCENLPEIFHTLDFHVFTCFAGRICVPIDPEKVDEFDPLSVPTIR